MYLTFFGFREKPFNLTPDPKFLYLNASYREALASLRFGINERKGFVSLIGEAGTGKTTLLRRLLAELGPDVRSVLVLNPAVGFDELLAFILTDLGHVPAPGTRKLQMLEILNAELLDTLARGGNVVVLIDEAQDLAIPVLEELRLLSNLETAKEKILQFVLAGQPELDDMLAKPELRQLRQRIAVPARLRPLARGEVAAYVAARIAAAGSDARGLFTASALRQLYGFSRGVPRLVNVACDSALVNAYAAGTRLVDGRIMRATIKDLRRGAYRRSPAAVWRMQFATVAIAVVVGAVMGIAASRLAGGSRERSTAAAPAPSAALQLSRAERTRAEGESRVAVAVPSSEPEVIAAAGATPPPEAATPSAFRGGADGAGSSAAEVPAVAVGAAVQPSGGAASAAATPSRAPVAAEEPVAAPAPPVAAVADGNASTVVAPSPARPRRTPRTKPMARAARPRRSPTRDLDVDTDVRSGVSSGDAGEVESGVTDEHHVVIQEGDTLTGIARRKYGHSNAELLRAIQRANADSVADRNRLMPGETLVLPPDPSLPEPMPAATPDVRGTP